MAVGGDYSRILRPVSDLVEFQFLPTRQEYGWTEIDTDLARK
jgi:hypothetical protein